MMFESTFKTSKVSIHYVQKYSGPDIVWCPGGDQIGKDWEEQFNFFPDFRNTSFDPRGAGKTISYQDPPWSIYTYAKDLAELIRNICAPPVILIGLSMGALIVQEMLLKYPELCKFGIAMGTTGIKSGFIHEWEEAEINLRNSGLKIPPDFSLVHYALLMYPSEVLGDDKLWEKCKPIVSKTYAERNSDVEAAMQGSTKWTYAGLQALKCTIDTGLPGLWPRFQTLRTSYLYAEVNYTHRYENNIAGSSLSEIGKINGVATAVAPKPVNIF